MTDAFAVAERLMQVDAAMGLKIDQEFIDVASVARALLAAKPTLMASQSCFGCHPDGMQGHNCGCACHRESGLDLRSSFDSQSKRIETLVREGNELSNLLEGVEQAIDMALRCEDVNGGDGPPFCHISAEHRGMLEANLEAIRKVLR